MSVQIKRISTKSYEFKVCQQNGYDYLQFDYAVSGANRSMARRGPALDLVAGLRGQMAQPGPRQLRWPATYDHKLAVPSLASRAASRLSQVVSHNHFRAESDHPNINPPPTFYQHHGQYYEPSPAGRVPSPSGVPLNYLPGGGPTASIFDSEIAIQVGGRTKPRFAVVNVEVAAAALRQAHQQGRSRREVAAAESQMKIAIANANHIPNLTSAMVRVPPLPAL